MMQPATSNVAELGLMGGVQPPTELPPAIASSSFWLSGKSHLMLTQFLCCGLLTKDRELNKTEDYVI